MRTSKDQYKMSNGTIVSIPQSELPPRNAKIWNGYDYVNQYWIHNGKRDNRTLAELRASAKIQT